MTQPVASMAPGSPMVLARICPACHDPNSTRRVVCRRCQTALRGDAGRIPRPSLGRLRLPDGQVVSIERPVIIGRRPETARFHDWDVPILIQVEDPHVSSVHLRLDLEDWSVLVTSLGRNGTILRRAGNPDRRFTHNEQILARAGDVYCLSAELNLTIEELA